MVSFAIPLIALLPIAACVGLGDEEQVAASPGLLQSHRRLATTSDEPSGAVSSCLLQTKTVQGQLPADDGPDARAGLALAAEAAQAGPRAHANCTIQGAIAPHMPVHDLPFAADYDDHLNGLQGLFVDPDHKFAFCLIEKNACSTWIRTVLQPLLYGNLLDCEAEGRPEAWCRSGIDYNVSWESVRTHGVEAIRRIFHDPTATRAVFVRDPMERLASAFMNKCAGAEDLVLCPASSRVFRRTAESLLGMGRMEDLDAHWAPQAYHCQLRERLKGYTIVSAMSRETFTNDMNCVLARAGLHSFIRDAPSPMMNRGISLLGPGQERSPSAEAVGVMKKLFTRDAARRLIAKYSVDYDLFGFSKEPAWMEDATGEWYDIEPGRPQLAQADSRGEHAGRGRGGVASFAESRPSWADEDIDDLAELAARSGYTSH